MNFDMNNQNNNGSLLRFRSAPSSVLQSFMNEIEKTDLNNIISQNFQDLEEEVDDKPSLMNGYSLNSQLPPYYPRQGTTPASMDGTSSYSRGLSSSFGMENLGQQAKMGSSLLRQNSFPAGLFTNLNPQKDYSARRGQMSNFSSGLTSFGALSRISEVEPETIESSSGYPFGSWEPEPLHFTENFTGLKRELDDDDDDDGNIFGGPQNVDNMGNHPPLLSRHLSLPKNSGEMADVENFPHFQDSVPCKIRAKRGCATHPRSIAERVRRTRISQRMRKLQELVPNMDNQTNTSDMLDLAVDYIKDLQKQYKTLSDCRANCRCSAMSCPN